MKTPEQKEIAEQHEAWRGDHAKSLDNIKHWHKEIKESHTILMDLEPSLKDNNKQILRLREIEALIKLHEGELQGFEAAISRHERHIRYHEAAMMSSENMGENYHDIAREHKEEENFHKHQQQILEDFKAKHKKRCEIIKNFCQEMTA